MPTNVPVMLVFQIQCKTVRAIVMGMVNVYLVSATVFQDFTEQIVLKVLFSLCLQITTACV